MSFTAFTVFQGLTTQAFLGDNECIFKKLCFQIFLMLIRWMALQDFSYHLTLITTSQLVKS